MKKYIWYIVLLLLTLLQACKHDDGEPQGESICASDQFHFIEDFKVNNATSSGQHIDFTYAPYNVHLTAKFSEKAIWKITITGQTSGAVKTFTDKSEDVDIYWYGNADGDVFFQTGENCSIVLEPSCKAAVTRTIIIDHVAIFDHYGYLLEDMDYVFPVYSYNSDVEGIDGYVRNVDTTLANPSPQGGRCRKLYAPLYHSGWYIGGFGSNTDLSSFAGTISSDSIYVNFYLKGNTNTVCLLSIKENVGGTECIFNKSIPITWIGWKFISYKLTDLSIGVPANIKNIDLQAGSNIYNAETECYVDFVILTKNKPFNGPN